MAPKITTPTRIKTVSFRANIRRKAFETIHIEATADVLLNQTPEKVLHDLKAFVARELRVAVNGVRPRPIPPPQRSFDAMFNNGEQDPGRWGER